MAVTVFPASTAASSQNVMPNPSIEATNTGEPLSLAFAKAVPPLFAPNLKR